MKIIQTPIQNSNKFKPQIHIISIIIKTLRAFPSDILSGFLLLLFLCYPI